MINEVSFFLLWLLVLILSFLVLKLYKVISGFTRKRELAKNNEGIESGSVYPRKSFKVINNKKDVKIESDVLGTVIIFTKYTCELCKQVYPVLPEIQTRFKGYQFIIMTNSSVEESNEISNKYQLSNIPISLIEYDEFAELGVVAFPFAYLLSPKGKVISKGIINFKEDFNILLEYKGKAS